MSWQVSFLDDDVREEMDAQPDDIRASFRRIAELIAAFGLERVPGKYVRHVAGKIWEMRLKGRDGIARALYVTASANAWLSSVSSERKRRRPQDAKLTSR